MTANLLITLINSLQANMHLFAWPHKVVVFEVSYIFTNHRRVNEFVVGSWYLRGCRSRWFLN
jgi:hypothetical protein